jgi:hypothetical protein
MKYAYLVYQAAQLAARLGQPKVSIIEFGVAGGAGLLALEYHAEQIEKLFPVKIEIYGFDTGAGLPPPEDYRDLPYHWKPGFFAMDVPALQSRLKRAKLVIGDIRDTIHSFVDTWHPAPIGAVSHDFDYYSSTVAALNLFDINPAAILPRVCVYFDDVLGGDMELYNDFSGERLAIHEFNAAQPSRKLSPIYYLQESQWALPWSLQMWSLHLFDHPDYNKFISDENQQLPI